MPTEESAILAVVASGRKSRSLARRSSCSNYFKVEVVDDDGDGTVTVVCHGKEHKTTSRSLFVLNVRHCPRKALLWLVKWRWFENVLLLAIIFNFCMLALRRPRKDDSDPVNAFILVANDVLNGIFIVECVLKVLATGLVMGQYTYLRDAWNCLDFVIVVSSIIDMIPTVNFSGVAFLRTLRVFKPLRSLRSAPEMKVLLSTLMTAIPKLGNVTALFFFIGLVFAITGMTLMPGIFYRQCRATMYPDLVPDGVGGECWQWNFTESNTRMCGGEYSCKDVQGYCFGHELETVAAFKPVFLEGAGPARGGPPWCDGSAPFKLIADTDFVHFDNLGGAFMVIFQTITMDGWTTNLMYYIQDAAGLHLGRIYMLLLVVSFAFIILNVALAVVDEAMAEIENEEEDGEQSEEEPPIGAETHTEEDGPCGEEKLWLNCCPVRICKMITTSQLFTNFMTLVIAGNVIVMMLDTYPPIPVIRDRKDILALVFLGLFIVEMVLELVARGPLGYVMNPMTAFDGLVVVFSIVEQAFKSNGSLKALRTFRLLRVLNKFAWLSPALKVLLQSMLETGKALRYWGLLFFLVLSIFALIQMQLWANMLHFQGAQEGNKHDQVLLWPGQPSITKLTPWCPPDESSTFAVVRNDDVHDNSYCIVKQHFDNFAWALVTIFQIMTQENWSAIMYSTMRSGGWGYFVLYPILMLLGQTLFLNLFLSTLLSKFADLRDEFEAKQVAEQKHKKAMGSPSAAKSKSLQDLPLPTTCAFDEQIIQVTAADKIQPFAVTDECNECGGGLHNQVLAPVQLHLAQVKLADGNKSGGWTRNCARVHSSLDNAPIYQERRKPWPKDYAWFVLHKSSCIRRIAQRFLDLRVTMPQKCASGGAGRGFLLFDSFIMVCIYISTLCMMLDCPLSDPEQWYIKVVRTADLVFVVIFAVEMLVKWLAFPLFWGDGAYLLDAWNWLDGLVVVASVLTSFYHGKSFLKTFRVLRAFRPLKGIKQWEGLKRVIETIFRSMKAMGMLMVVLAIFLLIFALLGMMCFQGTMYKCSNTEAVFLRDINLGTVDVSKVDFTLPLCLGTDIRNSSSARGNQAIGSWSNNSLTWEIAGMSCEPNYPNMWQRASVDTPICIAKCDPWFDPATDGSKVGASYHALCPPRYTSPAQLPHRCADPNRNSSEDELLGKNYVTAMGEWYTVPCAGSTPESAGSGVVPPMKHVSCRDNFCGSIPDTTKQSCKAECESPHSFFCQFACSTDGPSSPKCKSCLEECRAACECSDYCTPLIKDAALCHEQGFSWGPMMEKNFDNVWNAMLLLGSITTTEGWVDVMNACQDTTDYYVQPVRDSSQATAMIFFPIWVFLSAMFLTQLGVGVIVDEFMTEREASTKKSTKSQKCMRVLHGRSLVFDLENLHLLPPFRRKVYDFISHRWFENTIMLCIVANVLLLALRIFPDLETLQTVWWQEFVNVANWIFTCIFAIEAALKLYGLRAHYWKNLWNCFDFACVAATLVGTILFITMRLPSSNVSVIRLFRLARLFRLLKFRPLRPLSRLFMSLGVSLVKLVNVGIVSSVCLVLYAILGVNLFGASSQEETYLEVHANFSSFWMAFFVLIRCATGEAWNDIMHDLQKDETDYFREQRWCTPWDLFDATDAATYAVLKDKCLIDRPNACGVEVGHWTFLPWLYFVSYMMLVTLVLLNVVMAVVLEGYHDCKATDEGAIIDACKELWARRFDPDHRMVIRFDQGVKYIIEAMKHLQAEGLVGGEALYLPTLNATKFSSQLCHIPMKLATAFEVSMAGSQLSFHVATRQVLRFVAVLENKNPDGPLSELKECDQLLAERGWTSFPRGGNGAAGGEAVSEIAQSIAVIKLQRAFRARREGPLRRSPPTGGAGAAEGPRLPRGATPPSPSRARRPQAVGAASRAGAEAEVLGPGTAERAPPPSAGPEAAPAELPGQVPGAAAEEEEAAPAVLPGS